MNRINCEHCTAFATCPACRDSRVTCLRGNGFRVDSGVAVRAKSASAYINVDARRYLGFVDLVSARNALALLREFWPGATGHTLTVEVPAGIAALAEMAG